MLGLPLGRFRHPLSRESVRSHVTRSRRARPFCAAGAAARAALDSAAAAMSCFPELYFNVDNGYLEGLVRGFKAGVLSQGDYVNLVQCESLEGEAR